MSVEDKKLARELLRELSRRRNIDVTDVKSASRVPSDMSPALSARPPGNFSTRKRRRSRSLMAPAGFRDCGRGDRSPFRSGHQR